MNYVSANEVIKQFSQKAKTKCQFSLGQAICLGLLAGAFIAIGYLAFIRVSGMIPKTWSSLANFLGACVFPIGLLAITFCGGELVTGNMMILTFGRLEQQVNVAKMIKNWCLILVANCLGGALIGYLFGHIVGLTEGDFAAKTMAVAMAKVSDSPIQMIVSGIGCNLLVGMAIFLGAMSHDFMGKLVGVWFPIMIFVLCGFQHVVANAFILTAGVLAGANITGWQLLENILLVFIGNAIGGALFFAVPVYLANVSIPGATKQTIKAQPITERMIRNEKE